MAAACMAANLRVEQVAELQPAFPTFTEAVGMAALNIVASLASPPGRRPGVSWGLPG